MSAIEKCLDVLENFLAENGETSPTIADARAELDAKTKAVEEARVCLAIYGNPDNWKSHDGYLYLATMGHPWADARTWLTAHPANGQDPKEQE